MTETEREILETLAELDGMVRTIKTANPKPDLLPVFERLDALGRALPADADPQLRHYMQKKSFEKARLHLQGRAAEVARGACH